MDSSSEEDILVAIAASEAIRYEKQFWVHNIFLKRPSLGEFHHLFTDLADDGVKFFAYFRMSQPKFEELLVGLEGLLLRQKTKFREPITPRERLALTLNFLGHGNNYLSLSFSYRLGYTTVRAIIYSTCRAIWTSLQPKVMPTPTKEHWEKIEKDYSEMWNFPNCLGALDGKHVMFKKPPKTGSLFYNYKGQFSIVLLALVDANYRFITVDVGAYGRQSDGGVFRSSALGRGLAGKTLDVPPDKALPGSAVVVPYVIVADEAFPLLRYVMRPFPGAILSDDDAKKIFNYRLSRARRCSENAFGILTQKFGFYSTKFNIKAENLEIIVLATVALHNFLRDDICPWQPGELEKARTNDRLVQLNGIGGRCPGSAEVVRTHLKDHFVSPAGSVPWQREMINRGRQDQVIP